MIEGRKIKSSMYLKLTPLAKQEDRKHIHPKPNQRVDFATSLHMIKSLIFSLILSKSSS